MIKINFIRRLENFEADWIWLSFQNLKSFGNSSKISKFKFLAIFSRCRKWGLTWRHPSRIIKNRVSRHPSTCVKFIILEANSRKQMWWMDGLKTRRFLDGPWIPDIPRHMSSYCLVLSQVDGLFDENRSMNEVIVLGRSLSHNTVHFPWRVFSEDRPFFDHVISVCQLFIERKQKRAVHFQLKMPTLPLDRPLSP